MIMVKYRISLVSFLFLTFQELKHLQIYQKTSVCSQKMSTVVFPLASKSVLSVSSSHIHHCFISYIWFFQRPTKGPVVHICLSITITTDIQLCWTWPVFLRYSHPQWNYQCQFLPVLFFFLTAFVLCLRLECMSHKTFQWQTLQILRIITTLWLLSTFLEKDILFSYDSNNYNPYLTHP